MRTIIKEVLSSIRILFYYTFGLLPAILLCLALWFMMVLLLLEPKESNGESVTAFLWTVAMFVLGHAGCFGLFGTIVFPPLESPRKSVFKTIGLLLCGMVIAAPLIWDLIRDVLDHRGYNYPADLDAVQWAVIACASVPLVYLTEAAFAWVRSRRRRRNSL